MHDGYTIDTRWIHAHQAIKNQLLRDLTEWIAKRMKNPLFCKDPAKYRAPPPIKIN